MEKGTFEFWLTPLSPIEVNIIVVLPILKKL